MQLYLFNDLKDVSGSDSNKMKKLHERLITGGIAVLVAIFCYQVAYGQ